MVLGFFHLSFELPSRVFHLHTCINLLQSLSESQIPDALLERLLIGTREYPPVCAIIGGILGQVPFFAPFFPFSINGNMINNCYESIFFDVINWNDVGGD